MLQIARSFRRLLYRYEGLRLPAFFQGASILGPCAGNNTNTSESAAFCQVDYPITLGILAFFQCIETYLRLPLVWTCPGTVNNIVSPYYTGIVGDAHRPPGI